MCARILVIVLLLARSACADVIFSGYLETEAGLRFVLASTESNRTSNWLTEGSTFEGYVIAGFNRKEEALSVRKDGLEFQLFLKQSAIRRSTVDPVMKTMERKGIEEPVRLLVLADGSLVDPGGTARLFSELRGTLIAVRVKHADGTKTSPRVAERIVELLRSAAREHDFRLREISLED